MEKPDQTGTHVFDPYVTYEEWISHFDMENETPDMKGLESWHWHSLPVWADGNVYLAGAKAWVNEKHKLIDDTREVKLELAEKDGKIVLKTNLYDLIGDFRASLVSSETLGKAFEPEQRFENPDGTDIIFDTDYSGNHRGLEILPGPFAAAAEETVVG